MIKNNSSIHISLDSIYNEIIILSASIGECKSSIDHMEVMLKILNDKFDILVEDKIRREQNSKIIWGIFQFSPGIFIKTVVLILIGVILSFLPFSENFKSVMANYIK